MSKIDTYQNELRKIIADVLSTKKDDKLVNYLTSKSNLPSPRGNLELANTFSQIISELSSKEMDQIWDICTRFVKISVKDAPVNDPKEFLTFCGVIGIGTIGSMNENLTMKTLNLLKKSAEDSRWRTREAVAQALTKIIKREPQKALEELTTWIGKDNWLIMRAIAAGIADPDVLRENNELAEFGLDLHSEIFKRILQSVDRQSEEFKVLKKGLAYTLSVIVAALPGRGFEMIESLLFTDDADITWIVKQNLNKNRLKRDYSKRIDQITKKINL
ncbi:MAG: HEAT repeat domain-containing protein [Candidatus Heimdallarchaeota archaeon]|nr:HEAT repeat domain-containing protein [Candidatus Heimdallarchaeota archaeon]